MTRKDATAHRAHGEKGLDWDLGINRILFCGRQGSIVAKIRTSGPYGAWRMV